MTRSIDAITNDLLETHLLLTALKEEHTEVREAFTLKHTFDRLVKELQDANGDKDEPSQQQHPFVPIPYIPQLPYGGPTWPYPYTHPVWTDGWPTVTITDNTTNATVFIPYANGASSTPQWGEITTSSNNQDDAQGEEGGVPVV